MAATPKCACATGKMGTAMILFVTTSSRARECANALEARLHTKVHVAHSVPRALTMLQSDGYDALLIDESFIEVDDAAREALLDRSGLAMPIYVNLALHCTDRIVREVGAGLMRKQAEHIGARRMAQSLLRSELRCDLTGILLSSELVLRDSGLSPEVAVRIHSVHQLAERMRSRLEGPPTQSQ